MSRRIRDVIITLIAVLVLGGGAVWLSIHFAPVHKTDCRATASAGVTEIKQVLGVDVSDADRAVIQSGFTGKRKEIKGKANVAKLTARFVGTDPKVKTVLPGDRAGYYLAIGYYQSGTELGAFDFYETGINLHAADSVTVYSLSKKMDTNAIVKAYGLGKS